jgi:hypothetical protein
MKKILLKIRIKLINKLNNKNKLKVKNLLMNYKIKINKMFKL